MKKFLPVLFAAGLLFTLGGCKKMILQKTTVMIVADDAVVTTDFPDGEYKYFGGMTREELRDAYVAELINEMDNGKISVVESNADYVIRIDRLHIVEEVETEYGEGQTWKLARVGISASTTVLKNVEDIPNQMIFESQSNESLENDKKGKDKKGKKGGLEINGFGGMDGALEDNASNVRKELKKHFKSNQ